MSPLLIVTTTAMATASAGRGLYVWMLRWMYFGCVVAVVLFQVNRQPNTNDEAIQYLTSLPTRLVQSSHTPNDAAGTTSKNNAEMLRARTNKREQPWQELNSTNKPKPAQVPRMDRKVGTKSQKAGATLFKQQQKQLEQMVLWSSVPLPRRANETILVRTDATMLYQRMHITVQLCEAAPAPNVRQENHFNVTPSHLLLPECPTTVSTNSQTRYDQRMHSFKWIIFENHIGEGPEKPMTWNPKTIIVTYWCPTRNRYVAMRREVVMIAKCNDGEKRCPEYCQPQDHVNYAWDNIDHMCKPTLAKTRPPYRPFGGACTCESTCFTPEASQLETSYPWKSHAQRDFFYPEQRGHVDEFRLNATKPELHPCYKERKSQSIQARYACKTDKNATLELTCPIHAAALHHLLFIPEFKLIYCGVPKAGISEWLKFFRYTWGAKDFLSVPHFKVDREEFFMSRLSLQKAQELLNDPTWTKTVFFRDPAERLLSAYLNKIVGNAYTQRIFKIGKLEDENRYVLNFTEFLDMITDPKYTRCDQNNPRGLHGCTDPHWKPQIMTCGLDVLLPHFDFVGNFEHMALQTKVLLERLGVWETHGAKFDNGEGKHKPSVKTMCHARPVPREANETLPGFNQLNVTSIVYKHATGSQSKMSEYYTAELLQKVRQAYAVDYAIWDALQSFPENLIASGSDLTKEYCQSEASQ